LSTTPRDAGRGYGPAGFRQIIWRALPNLDDHLQTSGQKQLESLVRPAAPPQVPPTSASGVHDPYCWHGRRLRGETGHAPACRAGASECMRGLVAGEVVTHSRGCAFPRVVPGGPRPPQRAPHVPDEQQQRHRHHVVEVRDRRAPKPSLPRHLNARLPARWPRMCSTSDGRERTAGWPS
jgi:hypothetical protein